MMTKMQLISEAKRILQLIREEDIFHMESSEECVSEENLPYVKKWNDDLYEFSQTIENRVVADELCSLWIYNGRRVSRERINRVIQLLEKL